MRHHYADDGRVLTPPKDLEPLLKRSFSAFSKLLGHIRFFYMADEIWDGKSSLIFCADGEQMVSVALGDGGFDMHTAYEAYTITDEAMLDNVFTALKEAVPIKWHRPFEQLTVHPDPSVFPCGYRCDLCLGSKRHGENDYSGSGGFAYMNWVCYHNCVPGIDIERPAENDKGIFRCSGCTLSRNKFCRSHTCSMKKGYVNCAECGDYHSCDVYRDSHYAGQCNLGITAEEVTHLVIPYCMKERLDILRQAIG